MAVVPQSAPDTDWGRWTYLQGKTSGSFPVDNLHLGNYEARLYHDWPKDSYMVMERVAFSAK